MSSSSKIKTRFLIISDTHGIKPHITSSSPSSSTNDELSPANLSPRSPTGYRHPLPAADVALHCGDLTKRSLPSEYRNTLSMLRSIRAPLKLFICGNHDCTLDEPFFLENWRSGSEQAEINEIRQLIRDAEADGVRYLTEGTYSFTLHNGAALRLFASQYTPQYGYWAHQYPSNQHTFSIPGGIDIVMTHGPPLGILDTTTRGESAGCGTLLRAVSSSRPKIHCFGHIHESWGAYLAKWNDTPSTSTIKEESTPPPIDANRSRTITSLRDIIINPRDQSGQGPDSNPKYKQLLELSKQRGFHIDLTKGEDALTPGQDTLFVNAAIMDVRYHPTQLPWFIDLDLDKAE